MRRGRAAVAAAVAVLLLAGCGGGDETASRGGKTSRTDGAGTSDKGAQDTTGGSAAAQPASLEDALATVSTTAVEPAGEPMDVALLEARVVGELLRVRIAYAPRFDVDSTNAYTLAGDNDPAPFLVDGVNLKRYGVVETSGGAMESDVVFTKGNDEQPVVLTYYFAAPPDGVEELSLSFGGAPWPGFDVTVSR